MKMKIPDELFAKIKARLWAHADKDGWISLSDAQKSSLYEQWSTDKDVGRVLAQYMDKAQVRVYLKDTVMKPYARAKTSDAMPVLRAVGLDGDEVSIRTYEKPHGRLCFDRRVVCWGQAKDWKSILLAVYERAYRELGKPYAAVLFRGVGKMAQPSERALVADLASKLKIQKVEWVE